MIAERLLEYLPDPNTVKGGLTEVIETLQTEAPVLVQEIITWRIISDLVFIIPMMVVFCLIAVKCRSWCIWNGAKDEFNNMGAAVAYVFILFINLVFIVCNMGWIKAIICPRLFLFEYINNLLTTAGV